MIKYMTFCKVTVFQPTDTQFFKLLWPKVNNHSYCVQLLCIYVCVCMYICMNTHTHHKNIRSGSHKLIQTVPNNISRSFQGLSLFYCLLSPSLVLTCEAVKCIGMRGHHEFASCCSFDQTSTRFMRHT